MDAVEIGFAVIGILQLANLAWTGAVGKKLDNMTTEKSCGERRDAFWKACKEHREACGEKQAVAGRHQDKKINIVERKMDRHVHNGGGVVKYNPYDT